MAERLSLLAVRGGGEEMKNGVTSRLVRRVGVFTSWSAVLGRPRRVAARSGDRRRVAPHGHRTLNLSSIVARHSVTQTSLTVQLQRINTTKPLINSENCVHENYSPTFHLQLLFKDHSLIHHELGVTSRQSWPNQTGIVFMT